MKILLINGSPRINGNTQVIMNLYGDELQKQLGIPQCEIENVSLAEQSIEICKGCRACMESHDNFCQFNDDVKILEAKMLVADIIFIGTPVYVEDVSGLMKIWIDRMAFHCHRPFLNGKMVYLFTTSGAKASKHTIKTLKHAFIAWGARIIVCNNFPMGKKMEKSVAKQKYGDVIKKHIQQVHSKMKKVPIYSLIGFKVQKNYWIKKGKETASVDYRYWKSKGWLEKSCLYYYPVKVDLMKKIIVKVIGKFVGKILY